MVTIYTYDEVLSGMIDNVPDEEIDNAIVEYNRIASAVGLGRSAQDLVGFFEEELNTEDIYDTDPTSIGFNTVKELRMPSRDVTAVLFDDGNFKMVVQDVRGVKFYWFSSEGFAEDFVNRLRDNEESFE